MDDLITITDEEFDKLYNKVFHFDTAENIEYKWKHNDAVSYFEKHTGLGWHIYDENIDKGTVTLKILDKQKYILARLKYDF